MVICIIMVVDSHAHLNFDEYKNELEDVIRRSFDAGVQIITVGSNYESSKKALEIAENQDGIWAVIGCHPDDIDENFNLEKYKDLAKSSPKVVGIGEVGLDYFRLPEGSEKIKLKQKEIFLQFINLAQELDLPLVLHCRGEAKDPYGAYGEMLNILIAESRELKAENNGVIHCFGGNLEQARQFLDLGFYIGFTGIVTFKNAKELQAIVKEVPLDRILIETDAPFLAPEPYRGQRNEPSYVKYVCQKIAELKGLSFEEVEKATYNNTQKLFKL